MPIDCDDHPRPLAAAERLYDLWGTSKPLMGSFGSTWARNFMVCSCCLVSASLRVQFRSLDDSFVPEFGQTPLEQAPFGVVVNQR
jgi:hypothetical protein